jgi:hypothetical protein
MPIYLFVSSIHGDRVFTHNGERSKEGIVEFAKRAYGCVIYFDSSLSFSNDTP